MKNRRDVRRVALSKLLGFEITPTTKAERKRVGKMLRKQRKNYKHKIEKEQK